MERKIIIKINCGDFTCASEPENFCKFIGSRKFGTMPVCLLFPSVSGNYRRSESSTDLNDKDGWVQRCQACIDAEGNDE